MKPESWDNRWNRKVREELWRIRGLIEDASRDTSTWSMMLVRKVNSSAEERAYVEAMQERLVDLIRIITRRVERRSSSNDGRQWSETQAETLSLLEKAREARGEVVGKSLARLAQHLPKELPGSKVRRVTQAPAPPTNVGGLGLSPYSPKASQVPHDPPKYFPSDLWSQTNVILLEAQRKFPLQTQAEELCRHVIAEMTPLFCEAVKAGKMKAGAVQRELGGGMEDLLDSLLDCNDAYRLGQKVRQSDEWMKLAREIANMLQELVAKKSRAVEIIQVEPDLVRLGLADFNLHRLAGESDERLLKLLAEVEEQHRKLSQAVPQGQSDSDVERVETIIRQLRKALALRGRLPSPAQNSANSAQDGESKSTISAPAKAEVAQGKLTPEVADKPKLTDHKRGRERGPDHETSRQRVELEDSLRSELGTIKSRTEKFTTVEDLLREFPAFRLWKILSLAEQQKLLDEEFKPTAYARTLVMRQFGLTNPETIKKDRQKLRNK